MTKPLVFPPAPAPTSEPKASGPKPLAFPVTFTARASPTQTAVPAPAPRKAPEVLFQQPVSPVAKSMIAQYKADHPQQYVKTSKLIDQLISHLVPINVVRVMEFGSSLLAQVSGLSVECAGVVKTYTTIDGTQLINDTLRLVTTQPSFLTKLFSSHTISKVDLSNLTHQLNNLLVYTTQVFEKSEATHESMTMAVAVFRFVVDTSGESPDAALQDAIDERQKLMLQATMQSQVVLQQLQDLRRQLVDQLSRVEQLVNVTIPAYETAKSRR